MKVNKILIIDDSKVFLLHITELLSLIPNLELKKINDSRNAIKEALDFSPDLILTDCEMPFINGIELCAKIKGHNLLNTIPIVMLTANHNEEQIVKAIKAGANDYLFKNSKREIVLIKIEGLLKYKSLLEAEIKLKQIEAVKALVATSNHEFNNSLFIANGFISRIEKINQDPNLNIYLNKIKSINKRMEKIVKNLESIKEIEFEGEENEIKMLKLS